jgi:hypothetical protein
MELFLEVYNECMIIHVILFKMRSTCEKKIENLLGEMKCFLVCLCLASAAAGWCHQCNSRNPRCGINIDPSMKVDMTPCNGQCYTYMRKNSKH